MDQEVMRLAHTSSKCEVTTGFPDCAGDTVKE